MDNQAGAALQQARVRRGLEVSDAASALGLPEDLVRALEDGTVDELLIRYVCAYAELLGLDPDAPPRTVGQEPSATRHPEQGADRVRQALPPIPDGWDRTDDTAATGPPPRPRHRHAARPTRRRGKLFALAAAALVSLGLAGAVFGWPGSHDRTLVALEDSERVPDQTPPPLPASEQESPAPAKGLPPDSPRSSDQADPPADATVENTGDSAEQENATGDHPGTHDAANDVSASIGEGLTVQTLDGGTDPRAYEQAVERLEAFGYTVLDYGPAARSHEDTKVLFNDERQAEAETLRAHDPRFGSVLPNDLGLSTDLDLHVIIGQDWSQ